VNNLILVFAFIFAGATAYFVIRARRVDDAQELHAARAKLYASMREGDLVQPTGVVKNLASREVFDLWSVSVRTGQKADIERLLIKLREEEGALAHSKRKKNWARPVGILMAMFAAASILLYTSDVIALTFPKGWWARHCHQYHACPGSPGKSGRVGASPREGLGTITPIMPSPQIPVSHKVIRPYATATHSQPRVTTPVPVRPESANSAVS
jgi:hypothetical protein